MAPELEWIEEGVRLRWRRSRLEGLSADVLLVVGVGWYLGGFLLLMAWLASSQSSHLCPVGLLWCLGPMGILFEQRLRAVDGVLWLERGMLRTRGWTGTTSVSLVEVRALEQFPSHLELRLHDGRLRRLAMPYSCEQTRVFVEVVRAQWEVAERLRSEAASSERALEQLRSHREPER